MSHYIVAFTVALGCALGIGVQAQDSTDNENQGQGRGCQDGDVHRLHAKRSGSAYLHSRQGCTVESNDDNRDDRYVGHDHHNDDDLCTRARREG